VTKGTIGVGYRLFNEIFLGMALHSASVLNDYAMIKNKVSEFLYQPIIDNVHTLAIRKENYLNLLKDPFWTIYQTKWSKHYIESIRKPVSMHRG
jgi:hypothetical protein